MKWPFSGKFHCLRNNALHIRFINAPCSVSIVINMRIQGLTGCSSIAWITWYPVSYTHLDVYKRQVHCSPTFSSCSAFISVAHPQSMKAIVNIANNFFPILIIPQDRKRICWIAYPQSVLFIIIQYNNLFRLSISKGKKPLPDFRNGFRSWFIYSAGYSLSKLPLTSASDVYKRQGGIRADWTGV